MEEGRPARTLRARLVLIVLAVMVPLIGLTFAREWERRRLEIGRLQASARERATYAARALEVQFANAHAQLHALTQLLDTRQPAAAIDSVLKRTYPAAPYRYANLWVADTAGHVIAVARNPQGRPLSVADRRYFLDARRDGGFHVGDIARSRALPSAPLIVPFGLAKRNASGAVIAVIGAAVLADSLDALRVMDGLPAGSVFTVVDSTGRVQYRSLDADGWIGRSLAAEPGFQHNRVVPRGVDTTRSADGTRRMVAFETVPSTKWIVYIGIPVASSLDLVRRQFQRDLALTFALAVAVFLLGNGLVRRVTRPIESLTGDARAIAAGDLQRRSAVAEPREIGALASAFNQMAETVAERNRALAESEARYRLLFDANPVPVFVWSLETRRIVMTNRAAREQFGWGSGASGDRPVTALVADAERDAFLARMAEVPRQPRDDGLWHFVHADGHALEVELLSAPYERAGVPAILHVALDVTARRAAERALEESREQLRHRQRLESLGSFAAGIAHDFNNYLASIVGFAGVLRERVTADPDATEEVDEIMAAARRAADLTRQILVFSRREASEPTPQSVGETLRAITPMLARLVGEQVALETSVQDGGRRTCVDASRLEQVLVNLAANARDVMPGGGRLRLTTRAVTVRDGAARHAGIAPGDYVVLEACDTGPGVPPELRARVFDPFFTTKARGSGTGLGLSVVYGVVRQAGGAVRVDDAPGGGARFELFFPVVAEVTEADEPRATPSTRAEASDSRAAAGTEHILLVEDEPSVRAVAGRILSSAGYRVTPAANGTEALANFAAADPPVDLVVTDLVMPGIGGRELADRLRSLRPELRVLYTSGYTDDEVLLRGVAEEGVHFIPKPASRTEMLQKVREALDAGATAPRA